MSPGYRWTPGQPQSTPVCTLGNPFLSELGERNLEEEELGGAGQHGEGGFSEEAVNPRLARRDPFPPPSEQPCTEGSYSCFFTSSALAVRWQFSCHSNRNHPYTSISVNCCTQNAKRLLGCFVVKTTGPPIFCFNNKKFNLQDVKDQMVCSKLTIFHIPLPPPIVLVSKS